MLNQRAVQNYFKLPLVPREFPIEWGELTPILKMKGKIILKKYKAIVDDMYVTNNNGNNGQQKNKNGGLK